MYKEYLETIKNKNKDLSKDEVCILIDRYSIIVDRVMNKICETDEKLYDEMELALCEIANGETLTEEMAIKWVNSMKPSGEHWSMEDVENAMSRNNLNYDLIKFYVLMNMYYNDFSNTFKDETSTYIKMSRDKMEDVDAVDNWIYKEFKIDMGIE